MRYVEEKLIGSKLRFTLLPGMKDELTSKTPLEDVLEYQLCNGWAAVPPEVIGALTEAPILSDDYDQDEEGNWIKVRKAYWYPDYQIRNPVEELLTRGFVEFSVGT